LEQLTARHLTVDMYNCSLDKAFTSGDLPEDLPAIIEAAGCKVLSTHAEQDSDNHTIILMILAEGHFAIHIYHDIKYVAADLFLCQENASPEEVFKKLKKLFHPEKNKTTYLKRGDFGSSTDMKPKIKTGIAPFRRIHNTGVKVIRMLAHRKNKK